MTDDTLPKSKAELMSVIEREWSVLTDVVEQFSSEQMHTPDEGGWSPKDNLAHLTQWLKALLGYHIEHRPAEEVLGIPKEMAANFDFQEVNTYMVGQSRDRTIEDVLGELKGKYAEVLALLGSMPFRELLEPRYPDDPEKTPLLDYVLANTSKHFAEHRQNIAKML